MAAQSDWIRMRVSLPRDPKVISVADHLAENRAFMNWLTDPVQQSCKNTAYEHVTRTVTVSVTVTALLEIWGVAREQGHARGDDLVLEHADLETLDVMANVPGIGNAMAFVGWAEESAGRAIIFPKFFVCNAPRDEKEREQAKERKRRQRERERLELEKTERDNTVTVTRDMSRKCHVREEKRRVRDQQSQSSTSADSDSEGTGEILHESTDAVDADPEKMGAPRRTCDAIARILTRVQLDGMPASRWGPLEYQTLMDAVGIDDPGFRRAVTAAIFHGDDNGRFRADLLDIIGKMEVGKARIKNPGAYLRTALGKAGLTV